MKNTQREVVWNLLAEYPLCASLVLMYREQLALFYVCESSIKILNICAFIHVRSFCREGILFKLPHLLVQYCRFISAVSNYGKIFLKFWLLHASFLLIICLRKIKFSNRKYLIKFLLHSYEESMCFNHYFTSVNQIIIQCERSAH